MLMFLRRGLASLLACTFFLLASVICGSAQTETATLSGRVFDSSGLGIVGAQVSLTDVDRNTTNSSSTSSTVLFTFSSVRPSRYRLQVSAVGFRTVNLTNLTVNAQDSLQQNFKLAVGSTSESVTVEASSAPIGISGTVGTVVDQQLIHELPLQGRSFQSLLQLIPGVVIASGNFDNPGQFSVNGERTNANYFTVDGASANAGVQSGDGPSQGFAGSLPAFGVTGGTNNLVSTDAVQEFAIQTSSFAPEFGRTPGAQVSIVTKSGTNNFHGDLFNYLRNDIFDANDWFADHNGLRKPALRQNDFGGVLGGPIYRNKTFFFFSYEGLRLRQPTTALTDVPSLAARSAAPPNVQPLFKAFPLPTGPDEGNGLAPADYAFSNPTKLDATSLRLDHHFTAKLTAFARYDYAPSSATTRATFSSLNTISGDISNVQTLTFGLTYIISPRLTNDVRFNRTRAIGSNLFREDDFGGATPIDPSLVFPAPFRPKAGLFEAFLSFEGINTNINLGRNAHSTQRQMNLVDNLSVLEGSHLIKFGVDYRRLTPHFDPFAYLQAVEFDTIADTLTDTPAFVFISTASPVDSTYDNYSIYGQDTWAPTARLSVTYGLRWDYNPSPTYVGINGLHPIVANDISNPAAIPAAPYGSPFYHATRNNFAPRVGFAYQLRTSANWETVIKGGAGIFYDLGTGTVGNALIGAPFQADNIPTGASFPLSPADAAPPVLKTTPPFVASVLAFPLTLRQPYSYHWNFSIEQAIGSAQTATVAYIGSAGHSLLRTSLFQSPILSDSIVYTDNSAYSNYNSLQLQYRRRMMHGLDLLASYTYAHALDNGSAEISFVPPKQFLDPRTNYGAADFDIRNNGSVGLSYDLRHPNGSRLINAILGGWALNPVFTSRSATPVDVFVQRDLGFGSFHFRPDVLPDVPLYINDPTAPGGRRINPDAFSVPAEKRQGTLARNTLRGFPLTQIDIALRRHFGITERVGLDARLEAFNVLNHPNFAPPAAQLGTVDPSGNLVLQNGFGVSPSVLSRGLQVTSIANGFNPLYQIGGPRSLQLALKLQF